MNSNAKIIFFTVIVATIFAFASHVLIQSWEDQVSKANEHLFEVAINKDKHGIEVLVVAGMTGILPVLAAYYLLYVGWYSIPGNNWWKKGLVYCLVLLALKSYLFREPIMGLIMEVPLWMVIVKQLDVWVPNIFLCLILAWGVNRQREKYAY